MRPQQLLRFVLPLLLLLLGTTATPPSIRGEDDAVISTGKEVYDAYCVICHGDKGDGKGLMGIIHRAQQKGFVVSIYPRDFTAGVFKFRSTPSGELPTDDDLMGTVRNGIPRSGMPSHKDLSEEQIHAVVQYIKTFSIRWKEEDPGVPIEIGAAPAHVGTVESIQSGQTVYKEMKCWECHGETGLGDGPAVVELKDDWGDRILPFDFTSGALKGGNTEKDLLRTFVTGLDGTPMPSYKDVIKPAQQWELVSYCLYLMKGGDADTAKK